MPQPHYDENIWKYKFIFDVRPTVHTNPSRKQSLSTSLFKLEEFENSGSSLSSGHTTNCKRSFSKTMGNTIIMKSSLYQVNILSAVWRLTLKVSGSLVFKQKLPDIVIKQPYIALAAMNCPSKTILPNSGISNSLMLISFLYTRAELSWNVWGSLGCFFSGYNGWGFTSS